MNRGFTTLTLTLTISVAGVCSLANIGFAQLINDADVFARSGTQAPGFASGVNFTNGFSQSVAIDGNNRIYVMGDVVIDNTTIFPHNDRGFFSATTPGDFGLVFKEGDPGADVPNSIIQRTFSSGTLGNGLPGSNFQTTDSGFGWSSFAFSDDGSGLSGIIHNSTLGTVNDDGIFRRSAGGSYSLVMRRGEFAVGTAGATVSSSLSSASLQTTSMNASGEMAIKVNLAGGDVTGATNDEAIYRIAADGTKTLFARDGAAIGSTGFTVNDLQFNTKINGLGQIGWDTTIAGGGITTANDFALLIDNNIVLQEGTAAAGTDANFAGINTSANSFSNNGYITTVTLSGGTSTTANDQAIYRANTSGNSLVVREGDVAGTTGGNFGVFNNSSLVGNNNGSIVFHNILNGGSVTTADDTSFWFADSSNNLDLIAREGDLAPGLSDGATFGNLTAAAAVFNGLNQTLLTLSLAGTSMGTANDSSLWLYQPTDGLSLVAREGDLFEVASGDFRTINSWTLIAQSAGGEGASSLNENGIAAFNLLFTDGTRAAVRLDLNSIAIPEPSSFAMFTAMMLAAGCTRRRNRI